jgi:hypothetical protein
MGLRRTGTLGIVLALVVSAIVLPLSGTASAAPSKPRDCPRAASFSYNTGNHSATVTVTQNPCGTYKFWAYAKCKETLSGVVYPAVGRTVSAVGAKSVADCDTKDGSTQWITAGLYLQTPSGEKIKFCKLLC